MPGPALEGREDALQRHPELTEIDLKDDDVVCGRLDPVLEEDPPAGPQLEEAGDSFPVGSAPALGVPATRAPGSAAPEPPPVPRRRSPSSAPRPPGRHSHVVGIKVDHGPAAPEVGRPVKGRRPGHRPRPHTTASTPGQATDGPYEPVKEDHVLRRQLGLEPHGWGLWVL